jgi:hypothetical protein
MKMGTRKTMSPAQLAANRRNAQKSTGPQTERGKAAAKMNALKHGVLAQTVLVRGQQFQESAGEFEQLCREFYASLAPEGPLEEMLVDQIIQAVWRQRRARTAESGEIALSVDGGHWQRQKHNPLPVILNLPQTPFSDALTSQLERSALGCHYLIYCLRKVAAGVERDGELTEPVLDDFKLSLRGRPDPIVRKLEAYRAGLATNPAPREPAAGRERHRAEVLKFLDEKIRNLQFWEEQRSSREEAEEQARQAAAVLPADTTLDKILRYEAALERQIYRAMNQLERLQRRRQGEVIPAPMAMEIAARP